jgi:hypothetical protein
MPATLIKNGKKVVIQNDAEARPYFAQGYTLMGKPVQSQPLNQPGALPSALDSAQSEYDTAQSRLNQGVLNANDLPTRFEAAAKEANPNYGLTRAEILVKYNDPKYNDTNSESYIDPNSRVAMANRLASGYQGVLKDATSRASALYGNEVQTRQNAAQMASDKLKNAQSERDFLRSAAFSQSGLESGVAPDEALGAVGSPIRKLFEGLSTEARRQKAFDEGYKNRSLANSSATTDKSKVKATTQQTVDMFGNKFSPGLAFADENGLPIAPMQYAANKGMTIDQVLQDSPDPNDKVFVAKYRDLQQRAANGQNIASDYQQLRKDYAHIFGDLPSVQQDTPNNALNALGPYMQGAFAQP